MALASLQVRSPPDDVRDLVMKHAAASGGNDSYQLGRCSKDWMRTSNRTQTMFTCDADELAQALPFLGRLENLDAITLKGSHTHRSTLASGALSSLPASLRLKVLKLMSGLSSYTTMGMNAHPDPSMIVQNLGSALLPWSQSLNTLLLHNCHLANNDDMMFSSPGFFSKFAFLTSLTLHDLHSTPLMYHLDVAGCAALQVLDCERCGLSSLDVTGCTALTSITCTRNDLISLDLSMCASLEQLHCSLNGFINLDLSASPCLQVLDCDGFQLATLILSAEAKLRTLDCNSGVVISGGAAVALLASDATTIMSMSPAIRSNIQAIEIPEFYSVTGSLEGFKKLRSLTCSTGKDASLDFTGCSEVVLEVYCDGPGLTIHGRSAVKTLDLRGMVSIGSFYSFTALQELRFDLDSESLELDFLDLSRCTTLRTVIITNDQGCKTELLCIILRGCALLEKLHVNEFESLIKLDVTPCINLKDLSCSGSGLRSLDVSSCELLTSLNVEYSSMLQELCTTGCAMLSNVQRDNCPHLRE